MRSLGGQMLDFDRRAVVVTGATGNLGRAVVRAYLAAGAHVAAPVRDGSKGEALRDALGELAGGGDDPRLLIVEAQLADRAAMDAFVERVLRAWGRLDALANLAGGFSTGSADDLGSIDALWDQNVQTVVVPAAACLAPMRARGYGRIVSVAAGSALKAGRHLAGYAMAKAAVVRWTEALSAETKGQGITVNAILPSTIDHPQNRAAMPKSDPRQWVQPEEAAALILFLTGAEASGITGAAIPITGRT